MGAIRRNAAADGLGLFDLSKGRSGVSDGEEEIVFFIPADGAVAPIHDRLLDTRDGCHYTYYTTFKINQQIYQHFVTSFGNLRYNKNITRHGDVSGGYRDSFIEILHPLLIAKTIAGE